MTEDDYIDLRNLQALITACDAINRVLPYERDYINDDEFREVEKKIMIWRDALYKRIDMVRV